MMDPYERLTCEQLVAHPYFDMYDKMLDSGKDEMRRVQKRSHVARDKNNSRTTVSINVTGRQCRSLSRAWSL